MHGALFNEDEETVPELSRVDTARCFPGGGLGQPGGVEGGLGTIRVDEEGDSEHQAAAVTFLSGSLPLSWWVSDTRPEYCGCCH